jgi:ribonuclease HII
MNKGQEAATRRLLASDAKFVIGVDEVGLGAWAGPLVVAAVVLHKGWGHPEIRDSKSFSGTKKNSAHDKRRKVLDTIIKPAEVFSIVERTTSEQVDKLGIGVALDRAMCKVIRTSHAFYTNSVVVVDGDKRPPIDSIDDKDLIVMPKADTMIQAVCAASILAKVTRDALMRLMDKAYPQYGFARHVGYGTKDHKDALEEHGPCPLHRRSYRPIRDIEKRLQEKEHISGPLTQRPFQQLGKSDGK